MHGEYWKSWVEFEIDEKLLERPNGLKRYIAPFEWVVTNDIVIPINVKFYIPEK